MSEFRELENACNEKLDCENAIRVCDPENWFDVIEQCKICGRCV